MCGKINLGAGVGLGGTGTDLFQDLCTRMFCFFFLERGSSAPHILVGKQPLACDRENKHLKNYGYTGKGC